MLFAGYGPHTNITEHVQFMKTDFAMSNVIAGAFGRSNGQLANQ